MFLQQMGVLTSAMALSTTLPRWAAAQIPDTALAPFFKISLAQWSLHKSIFGGSIDNLDFPMAARNTFGIDAVEYVNQFFKESGSAYVGELKKRCDDHGVRSLLIMIDKEGGLGDTDKKARKIAVKNHYKWVDAAHLLGCHSIRVNAFGEGSSEAVSAAASNSLHELGAYAAKAGLNVIVENHGHYSSNGQWLANVIRNAEQPNVGTLPDFGNFCIRRDGGHVWEGKCVEEYDRYKGVAEMMPFAKGVSAKTYEFDAAGNETTIDYPRMLKVVKDAGYTGHIGIEYEGSKHSEEAGIRLTKALLERVGTILE